MPLGWLGWNVDQAGPLWPRNGQWLGYRSLPATIEARYHVRRKSLAPFAAVALIASVAVNSSIVWRLRQEEGRYVVSFSFTLVICLRLFQAVLCGFVVSSKLPQQSRMLCYYAEMCSVINNGGFVVGQCSSVFILGQALFAFWARVLLANTLRAWMLGQLPIVMVLTEVVVAGSIVGCTSVAWGLTDDLAVLDAVVPTLVSVAAIFIIVFLGIFRGHLKSRLHRQSLPPLAVVQQSTALAASVLGTVHGDDHYDDDYTVITNQACSNNGVDLNSVCSGYIESLSSQSTAWLESTHDLPEDDVSEVLPAGATVGSDELAQPNSLSIVSPRNAPASSNRQHLEDDNIAWDRMELELEAFDAQDMAQVHPLQGLAIIEDLADTNGPPTTAAVVAFVQQQHWRQQHILQWCSSARAWSMRMRVFEQLEASNFTSELNGVLEQVWTHMGCVPEDHEAMTPEEHLDEFLVWVESSILRQPNLPEERDQIELYVNMVSGLISAYVGPSDSESWSGTTATTATPGTGTSLSS